MRFIYLFIAFVAFPIVALSQNDEKLTPPKAAIIPHFDTTHQDIRQDNYFWMRKKDSPEVINHLYAENGFADLTMQPHQLLQKKIFDELRGMRNEKNTSLPNKSNGYYYYSKTEPDLNYPFYYLPYYPYNPELYKNKLDFAKSTEIRLIFDEFTQMLNQYKIKESYDYYKLSENLYINFSNTLEYPYSKNGSLQTSQKIVDTTVNKSGC